MIDWFERQIEHGQGEHHFGKVPGRVNEVARDERLAFGVGGEVVPKGIDQDQVGILLIDEELVVVVFRPFLGRGQFPVKLADSLSFFQSCPEGSIGCPFPLCFGGHFVFFGHFHQEFSCPFIILFKLESKNSISPTAFASSLTPKSASALAVALKLRARARSALPPPTPPF